jgi:hypothetical protein
MCVWWVWWVWCVVCVVRVVCGVWCVVCVCGVCGVWRAGVVVCWCVCVCVCVCVVWCCAPCIMYVDLEGHQQECPKAEYRTEVWRLLKAHPHRFSWVLVSSGSHSFVPCPAGLCPCVADVVASQSHCTHCRRQALRVVGGGNDGIVETSFCLVGVSLLLCLLEVSFLLLPCGSFLAPSAFIHPLLTCPGAAASLSPQCVLQLHAAAHCNGCDIFGYCL